MQQYEEVGTALEALCAEDPVCSSYLGTDAAAVAAFVDDVLDNVEPPGYCDEVELDQVARYEEELLEHVPAGAGPVDDRAGEFVGDRGRGTELGEHRRRHRDPDHRRNHVAQGLRQDNQYHHQGLVQANGLGCLVLPPGNRGQSAPHVLRGVGGAE